MATPVQVPETIEREEFYRRTLKSIVDRFPGYEAETGAMFLSLAMAYDLITGHFGRRLGNYGLSFPTFNLLMILNSPTYRENGCPMSQLGQLLLVSRANITGLVDSLSKKSLVARADTENDRRVKLARITPEGKALLAKVLPGHFREVNRITGGLNRQEQARLRGLLRKLFRTAQSAMEEVNAKGTK